MFLNSLNIKPIANKTGLSRLITCRDNMYTGFKIRAFTLFNSNQHCSYNVIFFQQIDRNIGLHSNAFRVLDIIIRNGIVDPSSNMEKVVYVSLCTDTLGKGMNSSVLLQLCGSENMFF